MRALAILALVSGCAGTFGAGGSYHRHIDAINAIGEGVMAASLACDAGQTGYAAAHNWRNMSETNPIMGANPDTGHVAAYFTAVAAVSLIGIRNMPKWVRPIAYAAVTAVEIDAIASNVHYVPTCGL